MFLKSKSLYLLLLTFFLQCTPTHEKQITDYLFDGFVNPPADAQPMIRWWWNGNVLDKEEIIRQLDILKEAGIGGVEINPIAMPNGAIDIGAQPLTWLSREWNEMLKFTSAEVKKRDMIADIIVGSGWPFGGEFLQMDETIQRILPNALPLRSGNHIREDLESLYQKAKANIQRQHDDEPLANILFYLRLVPSNIENMDQSIDLLDEFKAKGKLDFVVPPGEYELCYGILQFGHREVMHGAQGAVGPVMDHYRKDVTLAYLQRLEKLKEDTGLPLNQLIRALFCDSIELAGANWTDNLADVFYQTYGYRLEPYFPFVFYEPGTGYKPLSGPSHLNDEIKRVRYDYNKLLVDVFIDNFVKPFQRYCSDHELLCRYQAYGTPFLMGLMEGNLIPDIPESNNWMYTTDMDAPAWTWNQTHGYMIWNMYAASAGHLKGRKIISCESMTNTRGVFKASLEEIKQHDDMNFITGMNHAVLHGYNYSPVEAGFPGWVRYGTYFSEQNTWWPYFRHWADYNARLSFVFQHSKPVKQFAIMAPVSDIWSESGLTRIPFHQNPWYAHKLWEFLSNVGSSCDYVNEQIIRDANVSEGRLNYGPMSYEVIFLADVHSLHPETARKLSQFAADGGKLILCNHVPARSPSRMNATENDRLVQSAFERMLKNYPENVILVSGPPSVDALLPWTKDLLSQTKVKPDINIHNPEPFVYQIRKKYRNQDVFFLVNAHRKNYAQMRVDFYNPGKVPWVWDPESGTRHIAAFEKNNGEYLIRLEPLQSLLLIFEDDKSNEPFAMSTPEAGNQVTEISGPWKVQFKHHNGAVFNRDFDELIDFSQSGDEELSSFAGVVRYTIAFESSGAAQWLELDHAHRGIVEVMLNGKPLGLRWYGKLRYPVSNALQKGSNSLEIIYTSVLANYMRSLTENPTAVYWTRGFEGNIPIGIEGKVKLSD
ncbi:MAG: hypothetical protein JJU28_07140 [Cyclobacteriaceae bacterium]|nr:hypothetical protein [Cyclobacteriaceae bacterium]